MHNSGNMGKTSTSAEQINAYHKKKEIEIKRMKEKKKDIMQTGKNKQNKKRRYKERTRLLMDRKISQKSK